MASSTPHQVRQRVQSFLRKHGFSYAEWTSELACYRPNEDEPTKSEHLDPHTSKYREWSDLEYYLYNELGVNEPVAFEARK